MNNYIATVFYLLYDDVLLTRTENYELILFVHGPCTIMV